MDSWSRIETRMLIELYKQRPCLYDTKHENYGKRQIRHKEIDKMRKEMEKVKPGVTMACIRRKIKTLQHQLLEERKKIAQADNSDEIYAPKLWCYEALGFLMNENDNGEIITNVDSDDSDSQAREETAKENEVDSGRENNIEETLQIVNGLRKEAKATVDVARSLLDNRQALTKEQAFGKLVALELKDLKFKDSYDNAVKDILQCMREIKARDRQLYFEAVVKNNQASSSK